MGVGLWARWMAMHGVPRAFMKIQAKRGDPLARLIASHGRDDALYPLMEEIRARGPLVRTPFIWVSVDHGVCREILRDKRFGVTAPSEMDLPRPLRALIARTDPGVRQSGRTARHGDRRTRPITPAIGSWWRKASPRAPSTARAPASPR